MAQYGAAQAAAKNVIKTGILPTKKTNFNFFPIDLKLKFQFESRKFWGKNPYLINILHSLTCNTFYTACFEHVRF